MPVNRLAINRLHIVGEKFSDVLVGTPVERHTEVVAEFRLELFLQIFACEQIGPKPVKVGELLIRQLVELAIGRRSEARPDEVLQVEAWVGEFLACAREIVRQRQNFAIPIVRPDQV